MRKSRRSGDLVCEESSSKSELSKILETSLKSESEENKDNEVDNISLNDFSNSTDKPS